MVGKIIPAPSSFINRNCTKKSHVRFFSAEASHENFSREIFSREGPG